MANPEKETDDENGHALGLTRVSTSAIVKYSKIGGGNGR
jgi:hypothetical protein